MLPAPSPDAVVDPTHTKHSRALGPGLLLCALLSVLALASPASAQVSSWVDIEVINGHVFVETAIGGVAGYSMIDTGAEINSINTGFLSASGLEFEKGRPVQIEGVFGTDEVSTFQDVPVTLFGTELQFNDLVGLDVGPPELQMIIGAGFLKLLIFQFDYPNSRMRVISRDSIDLESLSNVESRQDRIGFSPIVKVRLNDETNAWLVLDTGNNAGIFLDRRIARKQKWLERYSLEEGASTGVISAGKTEQFTLPSMRLGDFIISEPVISVPANEQETAIFERRGTTASRIQRSGKKAVGILGYDVLKNFVVTIDYVEGLVHVEPGQKASGPETAAP